MPSAVPLAQRPKRADGRRNYDGILQAARAAFESQGTEASLEDIARSAGVAIGTLYGHFATREALIEAAVREGLESLCASAAAQENSAEPDVALAAWFRQAVIHCSIYRGLVGFLASSSYHEGTPLHHSCVKMHDTGGRLLERAQRAGLVRADLTPEHLFTMLTSAAWARENDTPRSGGSEWLVDLLIEAMSQSADEAQLDGVRGT